jgi:CheY-like chemotaxis protein
MYGTVNKKVTIKSDFISKIWSVKVNINQIEQMLLNLLINAGHAMPAGGTIYLKTENVDIGDTYQNIHVSEPGRYVKITVRDTGTGMTEETKQRIFEPFFTTKEEGRGTGLGLASVYSTIKKHGGGVTVESRIGEGTVFNIFLPSVNSTKKIVEEKNGLQGGIHKGLGTILLVDDEEAIAAICKESLQSLGYDVLIATNGFDGLKLFLKYRRSISLVIIDLIMPKMSGGELFDRLKEMDPHIKVLLTTGCNSNDEVQNILHRGCNGFIKKPFGLEKLSWKLKEIMQYKHGEINREHKNPSPCHREADCKNLHKYSFRPLPGQGPASG